MKLRIKNTKLLDSVGLPIHFFHVTDQPDIKSFYPLSHFGTKRAAHLRENVLILKALGVSDPGKIPETLSNSELRRFAALKNRPNFCTYNVFLYIRHDLRIPDLVHHSLAQYHNWFLKSYKPKGYLLMPREKFEMDELGPSQSSYKKRLTEYIFLDPFMQSKEDLEKEIAADSLYRILTPKATNFNLPSFLFPIKNKLNPETFSLSEKVAFQRLIRFLEGEGYQGFVYRNEHEDENQDSYIIFRPEQVFLSQGQETEHEIPKLSEENRRFLAQKEKHFFEGKNILSPMERIQKHLLLHKAAHVRS